MKNPINELIYELKTKLDDSVKDEIIYKYAVRYYKDEIIFKLSKIEKKKKKLDIDTYLDTIFQKVCYILDLNSEAVKTRSRKKELVEARHTYLIIALKEWDREYYEGEKHKASKTAIALYINQTHSNAINSTYNRMQSPGDMKRFNSVYSEYIKL